MTLPLYLAPMAGITDQVFRRICFQHGCDFATTEMISAQGFLTAPKDRNAYRFLLARFPDEGPLAAQLFGSEPHFMAPAAARLTDLGLFTAIDINMGCPAQKVVGGGAGSALMKTPEIAEKIVRDVKKSTFLPVTVKMRLGWNDESKNALDFAKRMEDAGADGLTIHGRTRMQQYSGKADWETIARAKQAVSIPVIANGDIVDGKSALECIRVTGCDGLAIGRASLGNPWLFAEIKAAMAGREYTPPSYQEVMETAMNQAREMLAWKGEKSAVLEMRKHFSWYIAGRRGAAQLRTRLNLATSFQDVEKLLQELI
ncbi:MAG: tRNA dihydrouridine synthase DusB [Clostridiales bacterium]|nr:tRNA dihydrouridine synthase DusB [Clostridiales bacterium]